MAAHLPVWLKLVMLLGALCLFASELYSGWKYGTVTRACMPCRRSEAPEMFWFLFVLDVVCVGVIGYLVVSRYIIGAT